jgi:hypothetical protein
MLAAYSYITHGCVIALKSSAENVNYFIYLKKIMATTLEIAPSRALRHSSQPLSDDKNILD